MNLTRVPLGEVADFVNGAAFKPADWTGEGLRIVRIQNLTDPTKPYNRTTREVKDAIRVRSGDLLVSWSATLGVFEWDDPEDALVNQHIFRVVPNSTRVDKRYLKYVLDASIRSMERHVHGATMKHINRKEFLNTAVPLPPIEEQQRIAAVLDAADALRAKRRQALAKLDTLTQSIFIDMFGDPVSNPMNWEVIELGDVLERIDSGKSPVCLDRPAEIGEWGVLKLGAVTYGVFDEGQNKALPDGTDYDMSREVRAGDLLFSRKNTRELVGACAYVHSTRERLLLSDLIFRLELSDGSGIEPIFLHQVLSHPHQRLSVQSLAGGSSGSMPNISKAKLTTVRVCRPPANIQKRFVDAANSVRDVAASLSVQVRQFDTLFALLQQRAFRGEL